MSMHNLRQSKVYTNETYNCPKVKHCILVCVRNNLNKTQREEPL